MDSAVKDTRSMPAKVQGTPDGPCITATTVGQDDAVTFASARQAACVPAARASRPPRHADSCGKIWLLLLLQEASERWQALGQQPEVQTLGRLSHQAVPTP
jgi:hypothetical protein